MSDLLKQAIADAKAVRATALANAKAALEEAFTPKLQSMLGEKLRQEVEGAEEEEGFGSPEGQSPVEAPVEEPSGLEGEAPLPTEEPAPEANDVPVDVPAPEAAPAPEGMEQEPAPVMPGQEDEGSMEEVLGQGHPDPVQQTHELTETEKASTDYKKTTTGHKTEDPGKKMFVDAKKLATKGEPKAAGDGSRKASPDYKKETTGHKTPDPQGASKEFTKGPAKSETSSTGKTLEEGDMDIPEESLEEILRELENEVAGENCGAEAPGAVAPTGQNPLDQVRQEATEEEEINLDELLESDDKDEDDKEEGKDEEKEEKKDDDKPAFLKENISLKKELAEYRNAVTYLRDRINEVNLLNAKLLYTNKLFKQSGLTNEQKLKVIESFDLTKSVREVKIVYATLAESYNFGGKRPVEKKTTAVKTITEGLASKVVASTKPTTPTVLTEGAIMANRFQKLAGIRKS